MKKITNLALLCSFLFLISCSDSNKKEQNTEQTSGNETIETMEQATTQRTGNTTLLCKINGSDWGYTTADGLVFHNSSTNIRMATITFVKKLDKGKESVQLEYDVDTNTLTRVLAELKRPDKDGNLFTNFYNQSANRLDQNPEASMTGTVSLDEDQKLASGNALFVVQNDFETDKLGNPSDLIITISDLSFSGVSYSDTDDLKKMLKK